MSLPKKISPDNLKDTLVEIKYTGGVPRDLLPGMVSRILESLKYKHVPIQNQESNIDFNNNQYAGISPGDISGFFFVRGDVRVHFVFDFIVFNCLEDRYIGWPRYLETISEVISRLRDENITSSFKHIGIKYISEFKGIDIYQWLNGVIDISSTGLTTAGSILGLMDDSSSIKTRVILTNNVERVIESPGGVQSSRVSLVEIDAHESFNPAVNFPDFLNNLARIRARQKEVFFGLINDSFLSFLNPEY